MGIPATGPCIIRPPDPSGAVRVHAHANGAYAKKRTDPRRRVRSKIGNTRLASDPEEGIQARGEARLASAQSSTPVSRPDVTGRNGKTWAGRTGCLRQARAQQARLRRAQGAGTCGRNSPGAQVQSRPPQMYHTEKRLAPAPHR